MPDAAAIRFCMASLHLDLAGPMAGDILNEISEETSGRQQVGLKFLTLQLIVPTVGTSMSRLVWPAYLCKI